MEDARETDTGLIGSFLLTNVVKQQKRFLWRN